MSLDTDNRQAIPLTDLPLKFTSIRLISKTDIHRKDIITRSQDPARIRRNRRGISSPSRSMNGFQSALQRATRLRILRIRRCDIWGSHDMHVGIHLPTFRMSCGIYPQGRFYLTAKQCFS